MARLATKDGDSVLARIADEKRHENAYTRIIEKLLEVDPNTTMQAIANMMRKRIITMPLHLMYDGQDLNLFEHFFATFQKQGVYTSRHYSEILEFFITRWELEKLEGLMEEARRAQDFVRQLPRNIRRLENRAKILQSRQVKFSWIFNVSLSV
ncbi:hypothetical protein R3W88_016708 [Solanum pinnatisectum]|uniref:Stearoyl-[acyl-carrier-protein] 9-desaturase n=1 Tax=Solanum pinnatisectum TaxID=50273 RepID=A0AAV9L174_9SOLN|nr:hypothetical protein R3W88_016708 [Solanum pinnatisectum]